MMIRLSKHIEILLLSNDCVIVPGFGGFMAHHVDARKDKTDGSFLPPMRSIGFNPKLTINDSLLAQSYVEAYDISYPEATMQIEDEVRELRQRIEAEGSYEFNGIGTVSLNEEGNYEFSPCEAGILSPTLYGLDSFQLKSVEELRKLAKQLLAKEGREEAASEAVLADAATAPAEAGGSADKHSARVIALWRNVAVASIAAVLFLLMPSPLVNNSQFAGTHIDTNLLDKVMPKDITTGQNKVSEAIKKSASQKVAKNVATANADSSAAEVKPVAKDCYSIVVASHVTLKNAKAYAANLQSRGYSEAYVHSNGHVKVLIGKYAKESDAYRDLNKLNDNDEFAGAWVAAIHN